MSMLDKLKSSPLWLAVPSAALAVCVGVAVVSYDPLVFDPSLYETNRAQAAELETVDAEQIEKARAATDTPSSSVQEAAAVGDALDDGIWTGYAACGVGNTQNWKPYYVGVAVEVEGGKPLGVRRVFGSSSGNAGSAQLSWDAAENQSYLDWASEGRTVGGTRYTGVVAQVEDAFGAGETSFSVDAVSGATYSSDAIYNACFDALSQASSNGQAPYKAAGGMSAESGAAKASKNGASKKKAKLKPSVNVGALADGTWTGYVACGPDPDSTWKPYYVAVTVQVKDGKIAKITGIEGSSTGDAGTKKLAWDPVENQAYMDLAVYGVKPQLDAAISAGKNPSNIDAVSGATYSSKAIYDALYAALQKSAAAAGSTVDKPQPDAPAESGATSQDGGQADTGNGSGDAQAAGDGNGAAGDAGDAAAEDGVYYGYALCQFSDTSTGDWSPYYIFAKLKAPDGVPAELLQVYGDTEGLVEHERLYNAAENAIYLNWAIDGKFGGAGYRMKSVVKQINEKLAAGAEVSGISTVSGATRSSKSILAAYEMAAANAANDRGKTPAEAAEIGREQE